MIRFAEIINDSDVDENIVSLGRKITFVELPDGDEETYKIVGSAEADPLDAKISNDSPIAKALLNKSVGDVVSIETPGGAFDVKITKVEKA